MPDVVCLLLVSDGSPLAATPHYSIALNQGRMFGAGLKERLKCRKLLPVGTGVLFFQSNAMFAPTEARSDVIYLFLFI